jgi:hypothetical protein
VLVADRLLYTAKNTGRDRVAAPVTSRALTRAS